MATCRLAYHGTPARSGGSLWVKLPKRIEVQNWIDTDISSMTTDGAGIWWDLQHGSDHAVSSLSQALELVSIFNNRPPNQIPTMFRGQTV
jgi:hypothetical protein